MSLAFALAVGFSLAVLGPVAWTFCDQERRPPSGELTAHRLRP